MIILKLGVLFTFVSDRRVQGISLETYDGAVATVTHSLLFLNNQSDYFFFEVKSCGEINVTLLDEYAISSVKVALSPNDESLSYECSLSHCVKTGVDFATADYCSGFKAFWAYRRREDATTIPEIYFGEGCTVGKENLTSYYISWMQSMYSDPPFYRMKLTTTERATWKLGKSVCQPDTTTEAPATTTTSLVQCPSGKNGGSSTSMLSLTTALLIIVSASL